MPKPGESAKQDGDYQAQDADHREYWEKGQNDNLTPAQKDTLKEHADRASRYNRPGRYTDDVPRKPGGQEIDHGALMRNVKHYVADTLQPHGDNPDAIAPPRPLGGMLDGAGTPDRPVGPPPAAEEHWVCINLAEFMAGLLRELGYPVRETNVYLTNKGEYQYQSAAIQVWFDGQWHWVDPFTCTYDPQEAWHEGFSDMDVVYWNGTAPPEHGDWRVLTGMDWMRSDWKEMDDDDVGGDLHDRFYPKPGQSPLPPAEPGKFRAKAEKAGCFISTPTKDVRMYLQDSQGRITDRALKEIPGAYHIGAGTAIQYCKQEWLEPGEDHGRDYPREHLESIFVGTRAYRATWEEIGTHRLTLHLRGQSGTLVELNHVVMGDPHPAAVSGLPRFVTLESEGAAIQFRVTIDPVDPAFHAVFRLLLDADLVELRQYESASADLGAMLRRAAAHRERRAARAGLPAKGRGAKPDAIPPAGSTSP